MSKFTVLDVNPLFTLTRSIISSVSFKKLFDNWPADKAPVLVEAQKARDLLVDRCKSETDSVPARLEAVSRYLAFAVAIEQIRAQTPNITVNRDVKFKWRQTPIVSQKFLERSFTGDYWNTEVLHVIWLKAILQLDNAALVFAAGNREGAVSLLREVAGVFHYLASDRCSSSGAVDVPIEFQTPVFNALMNLALGQAYVLIANKGEGDNFPPAGLGKLTFTVFATYSSALDSIQVVKPPDLIHPQFIAWLKGVKAYYHAVAAIFMGFACRAKDEVGQAVALIRLAIAELEKIPPLDKHNKSLNDPTAILLSKAKKVEPEWTQDNFKVFSQLVPSVEDTDLYLAKTCTMMPNLPQPIPFVLPTVPA